MHFVHCLEYEYLQTRMQHYQDEGFTLTDADPLLQSGLHDKVMMTSTQKLLKGDIFARLMTNAQLRLESCVYKLE